MDDKLTRFLSFGGNSVKASSGINGADTPAQRALDIKDSVKDL